MADVDNRERRQSPRSERVNLVHLVLRGDDGSQQELATGRTLNLSVGGIRLGLTHGLPLGSQVELTLLLGDELLDVGGSVVYQEAGDDNLHAVGIEFVRLAPEARAKIEHYLTLPPPRGDQPDHE